MNLNAVTVTDTSAVLKLVRGGGRGVQGSFNGYDVDEHQVVYDI
jgi:hypothetical protein